MAVAFAQEGMNVVIGEIDMDAAAEAVAAVEAHGVRAIAVENDVSSRASMQALADATYDAFGGCHVLCNNAGVVTFKLAQDMTEDDWDWVLGVDLYGVIYGIQAFLPGMVAAGEGGHIVNTASHRRTRTRGHTGDLLLHDRQVRSRRYLRGARPSTSPSTTSA